MTKGPSAKAKLRAARARFAATMEVMRTRFPAAFPQRGQPKPPLKIGIREDILATPDLGLSNERVRRFLYSWTRKPSYRAQLVEGAVRVALDGSPAGAVSPTEVWHPPASNVPADHANG